MVYLKQAKAAASLNLNGTELKTSMKKRKSSRLTKMLYLFFAAVIVCNLFATAVAAANVTDWRHEATGYFPNGSMTPYREKEDASSCYTYNDYSSCAVAAYVYGAYSEKGSGETNDTYYSYATAIPVGAKRSIMSLVYERGRTYAALQYWTPDSSQYESISVLWSPDSTRYYG